MNKLNERLTLIANLSVVVGIVFLAAEMRQNTQAIQAQTRDSITEKQDGVLRMAGHGPLILRSSMREGTTGESKSFPWRQATGSWCWGS